MAAIRFKHDKLTDKYFGVDPEGNKICIYKNVHGVVQTFENSVLVDDRSKSIKEAKQNINEYWELR